MGSLFMIVTPQLLTLCRPNKTHVGRILMNQKYVIKYATKLLYVLCLSLCFISCAYSQKNTENFILSVTGGNFSVGHDFINGLWIGVDGDYSIKKKKNSTLDKFMIGGEIFFENGADKATVVNPTDAQLIHERYYHESNNGLMTKFSYYPFKRFLAGLYVATGPLLVYSIRTYETRAQRSVVDSALTLRLSEIGSDNKVLGGYKLILGYDYYLDKNWLVGLRADFEQFHGRDLNSLWGLKLGYRF